MLPLLSNPTDIGVGPSQGFVVADQLMRPSFQITKFETRGICGPNNQVAFASEADDANRATGAGGAPPMSPGVSVVQQEQVGPYDSVVLTGTDPQAVRQWLVDNGYQVTDTMMESVNPYVAKGDFLLALKLRKDNDVGDIQPIWLELPQVEACIPLRLTAIAAQADMDVTAIVLSNDGRAIPLNYNHVTPNLLKVDWMRGGANYRQIISEAADEGGGNAFTTEYAGSARVLEKQLYTDGIYDEARLRAQNDLGLLLEEIQNQGLRFRAEVTNILQRHFADEIANCARCPANQFRGIMIDPTAAVDEIFERVVEPERRMQKMWDGFDYVTRLYTLISPEEMTLDPLFSFDRSLPDIDNRHEATMIQHCGVGGTPGSAGVEIVLEDGSVIAFDASGTADRTVLDAMPSAARIEQLAEGTLIEDNKGKIDQLLGQHNDINGFGGCGGCAADARTGTPATGLAILGLLGIVLALRRKKNRR